MLTSEVERIGAFVFHKVKKLLHLGPGNQSETYQSGSAKENYIKLNGAGYALRYGGISDDCKTLQQYSKVQDYNLNDKEFWDFRMKNVEQIENFLKKIISIFMLIPKVKNGVHAGQPPRPYRDLLYEIRKLQELINSVIDYTLPEEVALLSKHITDKFKKIRDNELITTNKEIYSYLYSVKDNDDYSVFENELKERITYLNNEQNKYEVDHSDICDSISSKIIHPRRLAWAALHYESGNCQEYACLTYCFVKNFIN